MIERLQRGESANQQGERDEGGVGAFGGGGDEYCFSELLGRARAEAVCLSSSSDACGTLCMYRDGGGGRFRHGGYIS